MNHAEAEALIGIMYSGLGRVAPSQQASVWAGILDDLPYAEALGAVRVLMRTKPHPPAPSEVLEMARIQRRDRAQRDRPRAISAPQASGRSGGDMVRAVLGALADAGQDVQAGKFLGREVAVRVAEGACREWLEKARGMNRYEAEEKVRQVERMINAR
jgi:hypothetical protein